MKIIRFQDLIAQGKVAGKRVFIRSDLNVPLNENGAIADDSRIRESLECIRMALDVSAAIMVTSHLGRPREGNPAPRDSLAPVAARLADLLKENIRLDSGWTNGVKVAPGEIVLLENCRLNPGEKADDPKLARKMARLCDVYVNDAFGAAHRAEATTHGIVEFVDLACAGPLMVNEILAAEKIVSAPERPVIAIVGGSKVSTKLEVLEHLAETVDLLIVGGGIANTFMLAAGLPVGRSLVETSLVDKAKNIMYIMKERGARVPVPVDVVTAKVLSADVPVTLKDVADVAEDDMILDIGPRSAANLVRFMEKAKTILWNGPLGVFEMPSCAHGTQAVADAIAESPAYSIAGGGDTLAAIAKFGLADKIDYISTGGGAFLEMLAGKKLPAIEALERRSML